MRRIRRRDLLTLGGGALLGGFSAGRLLDERDGVAGADEAEDPMGGFQRIIWSVDTEQPLVALTFDDGPHAELTPRILEILHRHRTAATFMMIGYAAEKHPRLVRDVVAAGHEIGNHSWRHLDLSQASVDQTRAEIEVGARKVQAASGLPVRFFRPPRGRLNEAAIRMTAPLGQDIVLWSVTRGPKALQHPAEVANHVVGEVRPGAIVDLHDGIGRYAFEPDTPTGRRLLERRRVEVEALPQILAGLAQRGLRPVTLSDLLASRTPEPVGSR